MYYEQALSALILHWANKLGVFTYDKKADL